jgi:hypothetical protein
LAPFPPALFRVEIFKRHRKIPWTPDDAEKHTHKATSRVLKELWAKIANECLERTGNEDQAIREANAVIARQAGKGSP